MHSSLITLKTRSVLLLNPFIIKIQFFIGQTGGLIVSVESNKQDE